MESVVGLFVLTCSIIYRQWRAHHLPVAVQLLVITLCTLIISYVAHGGPSEAYFPPFTVLLTLLLGYGLTHLIPNHRRLAVGLGVYAAATVFSIFRYNFFVSNQFAFNYGPSIQEQRTIISTISDLSHGSFYLSTTDEGKKFSAYLDNYKWLAREHKATLQPRSTLFFINTKDSPLRGYPGMSKIEFASRDVYFY